MGWLASVLSAILVATVGAFAGFFMALAAVDWLRIPAREGESGYFVVFMGLLGIIAGALIGFFAGKFTGGPGIAGFAKGTGISTAVLLSIIGALGAYAWLQSDPAPEVAGRYVNLEFEVRAQDGFAFEPATASESWAGDAPINVSLYAPRNGSRYGTLRFKEARQENGRWIVPGSIPLYTSQLYLDFGIFAKSRRSVFIAFTRPSLPRSEPTPWSEWLTARSDPEIPESGPDGYAVRYRLALAPLEEPAN